MYKFVGGTGGSYKVGYIRGIKLSEFRQSYITYKINEKDPYNRRQNKESLVKKNSFFCARSVGDIFGLWMFLI